MSTRSRNLAAALLDATLKPAATATPGIPCPSCQEVLTEMRLAPAPGQPAVCFCGARLVFTEALDLRLMTEDDRRRLFREDPALLADVDQTADFFSFLGSH